MHRHRICCGDHARSRRACCLTMVSMRTCDVIRLFFGIPGHIARAKAQSLALRIDDVSCALGQPQHLRHNLWCQSLQVHDCPSDPARPSSYELANRRIDWPAAIVNCSVCARYLQIAQATEFFPSVAPSKHEDAAIINEHTCANICSCSRCRTSSRACCSCACSARLCSARRAV
eukprot:SAG31_NODE_1149_length_9659_cov_4.862238_5_plen_174_part_00